MKKTFFIFATFLFFLSSCEPGFHDTLTIVNQTDTDLNFIFADSTIIRLENGQWKDTVFTEKHNIPVGESCVIMDLTGVGTTMGQEGIPMFLHANFDTIFLDGITLNKDIYDAHNWEVVTKIQPIGKGGTTDGKFVVTQQDIIQGLSSSAYTMRVTLEGGKVFSDKVVKE